MQRNVVVLPQPEGPSSVKNVPGSSVKLASRMPPAIWSVELSKILVSPSTRSIRSNLSSPQLFTLFPARQRPSAAPPDRTPPRSSPSASTTSARAPQARCPARCPRDRTSRPPWSASSGQRAGGAVAHAVGQIVDHEGPDQNAERAIERDRDAQEHLHHRDAENEAGEDERDGGEPVDDPATGAAPHRKPGAEKRQHH